MENLKSKLSWSDFKLNSDGMVPVIVQDYKTDQVLMLAYMNEEAYLTTLKLGKMTYWSRSQKRAVDQRTYLRPCSVREIIDY